MITLHNTLTGNQDEFTPQSEEKVTLYTCGPTVYSEPLIGNWVAYLRWDTLVRTLKANDYTVERVMNITDVGHLVSDADDGEDKMEKGAKREGITAWEVAARYTDSFLAGMKSLNLLPPEHLTKATDFIPEQIALVQTLEAKGYTYIIDDGVYFDTSKFPSYADFAHLDLEGLKAGARIDTNDQKRAPQDFALWKFSPANEKRDMEWESPWGTGFPGWHIECSAMAMKLLGDTLDIHTGGIDHIPVHHTNEIAQSEAATGKQFSRFWLHNNHLKVNGTKISKSLGNGYTLADLHDKGYDPMDFRMLLLQSHYRTEGNFTWDNLDAAKNRLSHWREIAVLRWQIHDTLNDDSEKDSHDTSAKLLAASHAALEALNNDLNTPEALRIIEEAFTLLENTNLEQVQHSALVTLLAFIDDVLGLQLQANTPDISDDHKARILARERARDGKNWGESDTIRDELKDQGIGLNDRTSGARWYYIS